MDGFERRTTQKKNNILQTALQLFIKFGVRKVSVANIAKKAGVSQVSIYNYFGSKQQLANEVVIYYIDQEWMKYEQLIHSDLPFPDKIQQIVFDKKRLADEINENFYTYLMNEYVAGGYIKQIYNEKAVPLFTELLQEGKDRGFVDENLSSEAMLLYLQMLNESMQKKEIYEAILPYTEDITNLVFHGIMGKKP